MAIIRLRLQTHGPARARRRTPGPEDSVRFTSLRNSYFPGRGVPLSLAVHGVLFCILFFLRVPNQPRAGDPAPPRAAVIEKDEPRVVMYLPLIGGGGLGLPQPDPGKGKRAKAKPVSAPEVPAARARGMSYPGRQEIVSDPPDPTNRIQTLEQPELLHPPILPPPLALPNMVQIAEVRIELPELPVPAGMPEPVKPVDPPPARPPGQIPPPDPPPVVPPEVKPEAPPGPPEPAEPPPPPRPADPPANPEPPPVVPPLLLPPDEPVLPPVAPMTIPVAAPTAVIEIPRATLAPLVPPPPEAPPEKAPPPNTPPPEAPRPAVEKAPVPEAEKGTVPAAKKVPPAPDVPVPARPKPRRKTREAPEGGSDRRDLLALTPMPAPVRDTIVVPPGEARGRFAISPDANLTGSDDVLGPKSGPDASDLPAGPAAEPVPHNKAAAAPDSTAGPAPETELAPPKVENTPAVVNIGSISRKGGNRQGPGPGGAKSAKSSPAPQTGLGTGRTGSPGGGAVAGRGTGTGSGSGSGPGRKKPFSGITIVGGSYDPGTASDPAPVVQARRPVQTEYGLTVISTETSGGGLPFTGIFAGAQIYTVYLDMRRDESDDAPSWTLEFALAEDAPGPAAAMGPGGGEGLILPFPVVKETPSWPPELVSRYPGKMAIVYAVVGAEGKLEQIEVKESPDPLLREPLLQALGRWVFRAARLQGVAVPIRLLMGIPLRPPR